MEEAPGRPDQAAKPNTLPVGTKVQSVPGPDELPQTFETIEAIESRPEWNAILPQLTEPQTLVWDMTELWLEGATLNLVVGDVLLIIADDGGSKQAAIKRVSAVGPDVAANRTTVMLTKISGPVHTEMSDGVVNSPPGVYVLRAAVSPFGHNAPKKPVYNEHGRFTNEFIEWPLDIFETPAVLTLSARNDKILPGSWVVIGQFDLKESGSGGIATEPLSLEDLTWTWIISKALSVAHLSVARYGMAGNATLVALEKGWKRIHETLFLLRTMTVNAQSEALKVAALPATYPLYGATIPLNARIDGLLSGRPVAITGKRQRLRITEAASQSPFESVELPGSETFPWIDKLEDCVSRAAVVSGRE